MPGLPVPHHLPEFAQVHLSNRHQGRGVRKLICLRPHEPNAAAASRWLAPCSVAPHCTASALPASQRPQARDAHHWPSSPRRWVLLGGQPWGGQLMGTLGPTLRHPPRPVPPQPCGTQPPDPRPCQVSSCFQSRQSPSEGLAFSAKEPPIHLLTDVPSEAGELGAGPEPACGLGNGPWVQTESSAGGSRIPQDPEEWQSPQPGCLSR